MKQEDINLLKQLGLTTYEAKAYITLSSLIQATADEISDKSDIPRSKIYDVLKRLNSKDYIKIESGRPLTYHVNPPINVLKREKEKFIRRRTQEVRRERKEAGEGVNGWNGGFFHRICACIVFCTAVFSVRLFS